MTLGGSYNDTKIEDGKLFIQQCGSFAHTGGVAGGTVRIDGNPLTGAPKS